MVSSSVYVNQTLKILPNPYALSIKPRLSYCVYLAEAALKNLEKLYQYTRLENEEFYLNNHTTAKSNAQFKKQVEAEFSLSCAVEILKITKKTLDSVSHINCIAEKICPFVPLIKIINSSVYSDGHNYDLIELTTVLGSIVVDSACISEAKFDFKQINCHSTQILDKVNLIVKSKINKQYPQLNTKKGDPAHEIL